MKVEKINIYVEGVRDRLIKEEPVVATNTINAEMLEKDVSWQAQQILKQTKNMINELNVFPVPDGDTGTNMTLTIMSAAKEVQCVRARQI